MPAIDPDVRGARRRRFQGSLSPASRRGQTRERPEVSKVVIKLTPFAAALLRRRHCGSNALEWLQFSYAALRSRLAG